MSSLILSVGWRRRWCSRTLRRLLFVGHVSDPFCVAPSLLRTRQFTVVVNAMMNVAKISRHTHTWWCATCRKDHQVIDKQEMNTCKCRSTSRVVITDGCSYFLEIFFLKDQGIFQTRVIRGHDLFLKINLQVERLLRMACHYYNAYSRS